MHRQFVCCVVRCVTHMSRLCLRKHVQRGVSRGLRRNRVVVGAGGNGRGSGMQWRSYGDATPVNAALMEAARPHYPMKHELLHVVGPGPLPVSQTLTHKGRFDESGRLQAVALSVPHALDREWRHSPTTAQHGHDVCVEKAMSQHGHLARVLVDEGVHVYLSFPPAEASEAVYNTDVVTGLGRGVALGLPLHEARMRERDGYTDCDMDLGSEALTKVATSVTSTGYGGHAESGVSSGVVGPVEFGDVVLHTSADGVFSVFQGCNSWRSDEASVARMGALLAQASADGTLRGVRDVSHVPLPLSGHNTLHLDYVFGYAGQGERTIMLVHPEGFLEPDKSVAMLADRLGLRSSRVITVNEEEMLAGACNISNLKPDTVMCLFSDATERVVMDIADWGFTVRAISYDQMSQKDGTLHCSVGQLAREYPSVVG